MEELKEKLSKSICKAIKEKYNIDMSEDEILKLLETPKDKQNGDIAFPCFKLSPTLHMAPNIIAKDLKDEIDISDIGIEKAENAAAYINFFLDSSNFIGRVVDDIISKKEKYGFVDIGRGKTVLTEYSSPNIAKPFHLGHLRTTIIGRALYNLYKELGYNVISIN